MRCQVEIRSLEPTAVVLVVVVGLANLAVHDAPVVVRRVEGGEDPHGDTKIITVKDILIGIVINYGIYLPDFGCVRGTLQRLRGLQRQRAEGLRREARQVLGRDSTRLENCHELIKFCNN